ncbi:MAG: hypothetical protein SNG10_06010 [Rikenellaceae bacterium]
MNRNRTPQLLLLTLLAVGCTKSNTDTLIEGDDSKKISFGSSAIWTKGLEINDIADVSQLTLYTYYADEVWENATSDNLSHFFTSDISTPITLTASGSEYIYSGATQYWPQVEGGALNFFAYYPSSELTHTLNTTQGSDGMPIYSYSLSTLAEENHDLVCDMRCDMTSGDYDGVVNFALQHILTKVELQARLIGTNSDAIYGEEFTVNGITFSGIYSDATLNIDFNEDDSSRTFSWSVDDTSTIELTAAQANTLLSVDDNKAKLLTGTSSDTDNYTNVMAENRAIFLLPQELSSRPTRPTLQVRIRRSYNNNAPLASNVDTNGEILTSSGNFIAGESVETYLNSGDTVAFIYETTSVEIPPVSGCTGWEVGQNIIMSMDFNLNALDEYNTPLTLSSSIYDWTETEVDIEVNPNIYIYASDTNIDVSYEESTADIYLYTNYEYDLRVAKTKYELDGSPTTADGFTFYPYYDGVYSTTPYTAQLVDPTSTDNNEILLAWGYDADKNFVVGGTMDDNGVITGGTIVTGYDGGEGFLNMDAYLWKGTIPGDVITCYTYDYTFDSYSGEMNSSVDWLKFKITLSDNYSFYYYASLSTRGQLGLYTNSSVNGDNSYGINKDENDAVYILRIVIEDSHLLNSQGDYISQSDTYGYFYGKIGAEILSNAGGSINYKFGVMLTKTLTQE